MGRTKTKRAPAAATKAPKARPYTVRALSAAYAFYRTHPRATSVSHGAIRSHFLAQDKKHPERQNKYNLTRVRTAKAQLAEDEILVRDDGVQLRLGEGVKDAIKALRLIEGDDSSDDERAVASYLASNHRPSTKSKDPFRISKPAPSNRKRARPSTSADPPPKKSRAALASESDSDSDLDTPHAVKKKKTPVIRETKAQLLARVKELEESVRTEGQRAKALEKDVEKLQSGYEELQKKIEAQVGGQGQNEDEQQNDDDELASADGPGSDLGGMDLTDHGFEDVDDSGFFDAKLSDAGSQLGGESPTLKAQHSWSASMRHPLSPAVSRAGSPALAQSSSTGQSSSPQVRQAHVDSVERRVAQLPSPDLSSSPTKPAAPVSEAGSILDFDAEVDLQARVKQLEQELEESRRRVMNQETSPPTTSIGTTTAAPALVSRQTSTAPAPTFADCSTGTPHITLLSKITNTDSAPLIDCTTSTNSQEVVDRGTSTGQGPLVSCETATYLPTFLDRSINTESPALINHSTGTDSTLLVDYATATDLPTFTDRSTLTPPIPLQAALVQTDAIAQDELQLSNVKIAELHSALFATNSLLVAEERRSTNLQYELDATADLHQDTSKELEKYCEESVALQADLERAKMLSGLLEYHLVAKRAELDGAIEKLEEVGKSFEVERRRSGNLDAELADAARLYQNLSSDCQAKDSTIEALETDVSRATMQVELIGYHLAGVRDELSRARESIADGKRVIKDERRRSGTLNAELGDVTRMYQDLSAAFTAHRTTTDALKPTYHLAKMHAELLANCLVIARAEIDSTRDELSTALQALLAAHSLPAPASATPSALLATLATHLEALISQHTDEVLESAAFASGVRLAFERVLRALGGQLEDGGIGKQLDQIVRNVEGWVAERAAGDAERERLEKEVEGYKNRTMKLEERQSMIKSHAGEVAGLLRRASRSKFWDDVGVELEQ